MSLIQTYFTDQQFLIWASGLILGFLSIYFYSRSRLKAAVVTLFLSSLIIRFFISTLDPFLHIWDEQFHALVARNMMENPFKPTLYSEAYLPYNFKDWSKNHIWLHKQPLFLWQIALSYKMLGINEIALRLPTVLMTSALSILIYRMGTLVADKKTGFLAALLYTFSLYILELAAGKSGMDHNDAAFLFYVGLSLWAFLEYRDNGRLNWALLTGVFAGLAVLNKWLVGLLVFSVWFLCILTEREERTRLKPYLILLLSVLITFLVFLPWQIFINLKYPVESTYEMMYNAAHFTEALEGHMGSWLYYWQNFPTIYGKASIWFIFPSLVALWMKVKRKDHRIIIFGSILIIYLFFSFAKTKLVNYPIVVAPFIFLAFGSLLHYLFQAIDLMMIQKAKKILIIAALGIISWQSLSAKKLERNHTFAEGKNNEWYQAKKEADFYKSINNLSDLGVEVLLNTSYPKHVGAMFYTGLICYPEGLDVKSLETLKKQGLQIAVVDYGSLPQYIYDDKELKLVRP